jgi:hypothetical protein
MLQGCCNVIVGDVGQNSASLFRFRSTTRYDNVITLALGYILLDIFLFLVLDFESRGFRHSSLSRLSLRRLRFRFFGYFKDFLRIKDELPFLALLMYS